MKFLMKATPVFARKLNTSAVIRGNSFEVQPKGGGGGAGGGIAGRGEKERKNGGGEKGEIMEAVEDE